VNDDVFMGISHLETTKQVREKLEKEFFGNERTKQMQVLYLKREFEALKMNEAENINDFITEVLKVVTQSDCWENNFLTAEL
jgi:predicted nuclease of restriction endonuclease-like RecB superfamily